MGDESTRLHATEKFRRPQNQTPFKAQADIFLKILWILVKNNAYGLRFRDVLGPWSAYTKAEQNAAAVRRFLTRGNRPTWLNNPYPADQSLDGIEWVSENAAGLARNRGLLAKSAWKRQQSMEDQWRVVLDHMIPIAVLETEIYRRHASDEMRTELDLETFLLRYYREALITKTEDRQITLAGWKEKMPTGWTFERGCVAARYIDVQWARNGCGCLACHGKMMEAANTGKVNGTLV